MQVLSCDLNVQDFGVFQLSSNNNQNMEFVVVVVEKQSYIGAPYL